MLGVVAAQIETAAEFQRMVALQASGQLDRFPGWREWTAASFEVRSDGPVEIGVDGEALEMDPPLVFTARPGALTVRLPKSAGPVAGGEGGVRDLALDARGARPDHHGAAAVTDPVPEREEGLAGPEQGDEPVEARIADRAAQRGTPRGDAAERVLREASEIDLAVYRAIASTPSPSLDEPMRRLSNAANRSMLWLAIAGGLAVLGGRTGRRAALAGVASIGVASATVNLGMKALYERGRPDRVGAGVTEDRHVRMPSSSSFPSGHSASGFAFATAVGREIPALAFPLRLLAGAVAYSRVHTGVHYPGDTVAGSLVGGATGLMVGDVAARWRRR